MGAVLNFINMLHKQEKSQFNNIDKLIYVLIDLYLLTLKFLAFRCNILDNAFLAYIEGTDRGVEWRMKEHNMRNNYNYTSALYTRNFTETKCVSIDKLSKTKKRK